MNVPKYIGSNLGLSRTSQTGGQASGNSASSSANPAQVSRSQLQDLARG
jgi:hypothetical protein